MQIRLTNNNCTLIREYGDKRISHESTTAYHMKRLLNSEGFHFVRMNPSKHGLTGCTVGLVDRKLDVVLWHEQYAIENAATAFNQGSVSFMRTNDASK